MSHLFAWFSGFAAAACLFSAMSLYVPLAIALGFVALFSGLLARHFWMEETCESR